MLAKAATLPADEVVVDLEDGVAAAAKEEARGHLPGARALGTLAIRINGLTTPWWRDDLAAVAEAPPDVVVVPKVESADDVATVAELLPTGVGLEVQIETARGLIEVERIAAADGPLEALVFGPGDFGASLGVPVLTIGAGSWTTRSRASRWPPTRSGCSPSTGPTPTSATPAACGRPRGARSATASSASGWSIPTRSSR